MKTKKVQYFSKDEKIRIIKKSTLPNGNFSLKIFLELINEAIEKEKHN
jgi:hypothetical protein